MQLAERLTDAAGVEAVDQRIRSDDAEQLFGVAERFHVSLDLLQLLGERVDLLHLVVDHLDRLRDVLDVHDLVEHVGNRVGHDVLRVRGRRRGRAAMRMCEVLSWSYS